MASSAWKRPYDDDDEAEADDVLKSPKKVRYPSLSASTMTTSGRLSSTSGHRTGLFASGRPPSPKKTQRASSLGAGSATELALLRANINKLECKVMKLETAAVQADDQYNAKQRQWLIEKRSLEERLTNCQMKLDVSLKAENELRKLNRQIQAGNDDDRSSYRQKYDELLRRNAELEQRFDSMMDELRQRNDQQRVRLQQQDLELTQLRELNDDVSTQLNATQSRCDKLEARHGQYDSLVKERDRLKNDCDQLKRKFSEADLQMERFKVMEAELRNYHTLQRENKTLRERNRALVEPYENLELLREQVATFERERDLHEKTRQECARLLVENERLVAFRRNAFQLTEVDDEIGFSLKMEQLLGAAKSLHETESAEQEPPQPVPTEQQRKENEELAEAKTRIIQLERDIELADANAEKQLERLSQLRCQVNSLQSVGAAVDQLFVELALVSTDLAEAFRLVTQDTHRMDAKVRLLPKAIGTFVKKIDEASKHRLNELNEKLKEQTVELDEARDRLELRSQQGDFDVTTTKVLHFEANPFDLARQDQVNLADRLQRDCARLKERLRLVEEEGRRTAARRGGDGGGLLEEDVEEEIRDVGPTNLTARVEEKVASQEELQSRCSDLQSKLDASEKRVQRYTEAFSRKAKDLREAVYLITGYKLDCVVDYQYQVQSRYAEHENDRLIFRRDQESGDIELISNEYAESLQGLVSQYLTELNSVPAFMSALTLDLFSRTTIQPSSAVCSSEMSIDLDGRS